MKTHLKLTVAGALVCLLLTGAWAQEENSPYRVSDDAGNTVHIMPTPSLALTMSSPLAGVLSYHGGPVMTSVSLYAIYWVPPTLQNGNPTSLPAHYQAVVKNFLSDYPGHGIVNNSTQYYSTPPTKYIHNAGGFAGSYLDTKAYPSSGCTDAVTPGNCVTGAQLQAEIQAVMTLKGWTPGLTKMFLIFTSIGEGSCFDSTSGSCAYTQYCAYHGYFGSPTNPVIFGNEPYGDPTYCAGSIQSPNGDLPADVAANIASHEITEANTDPELNAWWDSGNGEEIGDLCAYNFGPNTWDSGLANQMWFSHFYDLQMEYDNHVSGCVQVGP